MQAELHGIANATAESDAMMASVNADAPADTRTKRLRNSSRTRPMVPPVVDGSLTVPGFAHR
jgi:hypothetical protein